MTDLPSGPQQPASLTRASLDGSAWSPASSLGSLKYFVAALLASFTLEAIGVGLHEHVHSGTTYFYSFEEVWSGFATLSLSQLVLSAYFVLLLLRYVGSMFVSGPLFQSGGSRPNNDKGIVLVAALFDIMFLFVSLTLLFTAALSAQDVGALIETAIWLIMAILADMLLCVFWLAALTPHKLASRLGFTSAEAQLSRRFNARWLGFSLSEVGIWCLFILLEQRRVAPEAEQYILFALLFSLVCADFIVTKDFWRQLVTDTARRVNRS